MSFVIWWGCLCKLWQIVHPLKTVNAQPASTNYAHGLYKSTMIMKKKRRYVSLLMHYYLAHIHHSSPGFDLVGMRVSHLAEYSIYFLYKNCQMLIHSNISSTILIKNIVTFLDHQILKMQVNTLTIFLLPSICNITCQINLIHIG